MTIRELVDEKTEGLLRTASKSGGRVDPDEWRQVEMLSALLTLAGKRKPVRHRIVWPALTVLVLGAILLLLHMSRLSSTRVEADLRSDELAFRLSKGQSLTEAIPLSFLAVETIQTFRINDQVQPGGTPVIHIVPSSDRGTPGRLVLHSLRYPAGTNLTVRAMPTGGLLRIRSDRSPSVLYAELQGHALIGSGQGVQRYFQDAALLEIAVAPGPLLLEVAFDDAAATGEMFKQLNVNKLGFPHVRVGYDEVALSSVVDPVGSTGSVILPSLNDRKRDFDPLEPVEFAGARGVIEPLTFDGQALAFSFAGTVDGLHNGHADLMPSWLELIMARPELIIITVLFAVLAALEQLRKLLENQT